MRTARAWLLRSFILAFLLLILTQVAILLLGIAPVLNSYSRNQTAYLENLALRILINPEKVSLDTPEHSGPFFIFSADKTLLYSNRGKGRSIPATDYHPISYNGGIIGYYYAGELKFLDSRSNRLFLTALTGLFGSSVLVSLLIAAFTAVAIARRISAPVALLRGDINALKNLKPVEFRELPVSELSDISASLNEVSTLLSGEEEYKRQWMQNIAHDLRTPISGLKGQLEAMRDGVLPPTAARFDNTLVEVRRLEELASAVSELYRLENLQRVESTVFSAKEFIDELTASFRPAMDRKDMQLVPVLLTDNLQGNPSLLARAAGNILSNAVKFAGRGARVEIGIEQAEAETIIRISNNGPGIPEDQLDKIFQRFFRGEESRTTPGTGLGLNIAAEIIHRHNGSLTARNLSPRGVEFILSLPFTSPE